MADYDLYYWPVPFRGQFIRAILACAGKSWDEHDSEAIADLMQAEPGDQPIGFMGPPLLIENATGFALAEMPAIALYLGETLGLIPDTAELRARTMKIVNDANDVLDELTNDGGREMWTAEKWHDYLPRLKRWMAIWEDAGKRAGMAADSEFILGSADAGVADIVTSTLWSTMAERFPAIAAHLAATAPGTAGLCRRMQELPALAALSSKAFRDYGDAWCGGEIEQSLRAAIQPSA